MISSDRGTVNSRARRGLWLLLRRWRGAAWPQESAAVCFGRTVAAAWWICGTGSCCADCPHSL